MWKGAYRGVWEDTVLKVKRVISKVNINKTVNVKHEILDAQIKSGHECRKSCLWDIMTCVEKKSG